MIKVDMPEPYSTKPKPSYFLYLIELPTGEILAGTANSGRTLKQHLGLTHRHHLSIIMDTYGRDNCKLVIKPYRDREEAKQALLILLKHRPNLLLITPRMVKGYPIGLRKLKALDWARLDALDEKNGLEVTVAKLGIIQ